MRTEYYETFPKDEIRKLAEDGYSVNVLFVEGMGEPWRIEYTKRRGVTPASAHEPTWLSEALNEGNGSYSP